ncbi:ABC transporter permease [Pseudonocardia alni]|uniref:ABC transporter permease n=1 Tax=Pseudonocardia alni TaxID=33907 RepID=UPI00332F52C4
MTQLDDRGPQGDPDRTELRAPAKQGVDVSLGSITGKLKTGLTEAGDIGRFTADVVRDFPDMFRRYVPEVFRQAGILIFSSALIIWFMMFIMGGQCGLEASYTLKQIGAPLYSAVFDAYCGLRELSVYMWGWILAAKVGCGYVAEIGSMRISDEIDAMEVMGIKSKSFLVGTRIAATVIAVPFMYFVGLAILYVAMYLVTVVNLGGVSPGGFLYLFWLYQSPYDMFAVMVKIMTESIVIVGVGLYYGYNASGGPVGVGRATAKSMIINLVLISVIGTIGTLAFWGLETNSPIAN